jgi:putative FmdB family regulatory protein
VPTYQYACTECGHGFEQFQSFSDDALTECPTCGGRLRKVFNSVGIVFKGSGFYRNDSRDAAKSDAAKSKSDAGKDKESVGSKDSSSDKSRDTSSETKKPDKSSGSDPKSSSSTDKGSSPAPKASPSSTAGSAA